MRNDIDFREKLPKIDEEKIQDARMFVDELGLEVEDFSKGKMILDVAAYDNNVAMVMNELGKVDSRFGAFVMGTDIEPKAGAHQPIINHDVRNLRFPSDFEGFDTVVSRFGFPLYVGLDWSHSDIPDEPEGTEYDFDKPIHHQISRKEGVAHITKGLHEILSLLKPEGRFVSLPISSDTRDQATKKHDQKMIEEAVEKLRSEYPHITLRYVDTWTRYGERMVITISEDNERLARAIAASGRILRRYFGLGGLIRHKEENDGDLRILDVQTKRNDLAVLLTDYAKRHSKAAAFVVGINSAPVADVGEHFKQCDVRNLTLPDESFGLILSEDEFPKNILNLVDRSKKDPPGVVYDFDKPIEGPLSVEEAVAHIQKGFSEMLRVLTQTGRIRLSPPGVYDKKEKKYMDTDIIDTALENLRTQYPDLTYGRYPDMLVVAKLRVNKL